MSYAIRNDGLGWRAVNGLDDIGPDEHYSDTQPAIVLAPQVPKIVSMRQARLALLAAGFLSDVNDAIAQAGTAAQIEWEYAQTVERHSPLVDSMASAIGFSDAQLDGLFTQAATL